jgi:hypothetical protein
MLLVVRSEIFLPGLKHMKKDMILRTMMEGGYPLILFLKKVDGHTKEVGRLGFRGLWFRGEYKGIKLEAIDHGAVVNCYDVCGSITVPLRFISKGDYYGITTADARILWEGLVEIGFDEVEK